MPPETPVLTDTLYVKFTVTQNFLHIFAFSYALWNYVYFKMCNSKNEEIIAN